MTKRRQPPRWVACFLRALARSGVAREAALDAGVDFTTAYARRKAHPEFAGAWATMLEAARQAGGPQACAAAADAAEAPAAEADAAAADGADQAGDYCLRTLAGGGGQLVKLSNGRWTPAAERRFFAALADTANVKAAATAAGFSTQAVYARRLKRADFREQWAAAVDSGRARIELMLIEAAGRAFDPDDGAAPDAVPAMSVAEAIAVLKLGAAPRSAVDGAGG